MGWTDLVVEQKLKLHDVAGVVPIITGAGGFAGDWDLNPIGFDYSGTMVASSCKELAAQAVGFFKENYD
jgi:fructose-1,6-bisphosphatase/inositol monophosphatase family enzyme